MVFQQFWKNSAHTHSRLQQRTDRQRRFYQISTRRVQSRKIERYGSVKAIAFAEKFFCADSELIAKLLHLETLEDWSMDRQLVASLVVDKLLDSLGIDSEARIKWYKKYATGRNEIGEEFRKHKEQLHFLFSTAYGEFGVAEDKPQLRELFNQIDTWSSRLQRVGRQYHDAAMKASLSGTVADICSSFVHMHCNRYLGIDHQAEWKARALACRAHEARSNRKHDTQSELLENSAVPQA